ncbi:MAG: cupin domain-containing protein [Alphaproteobacteria bacterium]
MEHSQFTQQNSAKGSADYFTGDVTIKSGFTLREGDSYGGAMVRFNTGARTAHPKGQTIIIISGEGRAQKEDEPIIKLLPGDVVWFAPDEKHWHGASPHSPMAHIAILEEKDGVGTIWLEQVSEADFTAAP